MVGHGAVYATAMSPPLKNKLDVRARIKEGMVTYKFRGSPQKFLPHSVVDEITEPAVIRHIVKQDKKVVLNNQDEERLVNRIYEQGRKLFAICLYCDGSIKYVTAMLENGLTDDDLPLGEHDFGSLSEKGAFVDSFVAAQKHFITVTLEEGQFQELLDDIADRFSIPIHFEKTRANLKGKGAFGEVYQVSIHPEQRTFECETNDEDKFAMKITPHDPTHEGREQQFHLNMAGQEHSHLVKCRSSFTFSEEYHMIYDLANSDLETFITKNSVASENPALSELWLAQQLAGLAGAVQVVHNPEGPSQSKGASTLGVPSQQPKRTGYIHDIKPENILVFQKRDGTFLLQLSDFSCARVAEYIATISGRRDSYKTRTKSGTPIYRAPESQENATSRPYDMWSLGCVYLEILVWYIDGYEALEAFRESRECQVQLNGHIEDEGFWHETSPNVINLRKPVVDMITSLQERCVGGLRDIVNTIPELLKINPKARPSASDLVERLSHLGTGTTTTRRPSLLSADYINSFSLRNSAPSGPHQRDTDSDSDSGFSGVVITGPDDD